MIKQEATCHCFHTYRQRIHIIHDSAQSAVQKSRVPLRLLLSGL